MLGLMSRSCLWSIPQSHTKSQTCTDIQNPSQWFIFCVATGYHGSLPDMKPIVSERQDQIRFSLCCTLEALMAQRGAKKKCEQSTSTYTGDSRQKCIRAKKRRWL